MRISAGGSSTASSAVIVARAARMAASFVSCVTSTTGTASRIMDQGRTTSPTYTNFIGFKRSYQEVLNIVYGSTSGFNSFSFFPNGMNGNIS